MIGIFDSGLGGVLTLEYFQKTLAQYDYLYLGDTAFVPRGDRDPRWIHDRTFACLNWLFLQGCEIVILACNTASAHALRNWQMLYPHKKVLSITIPGVEALHDRRFHRVVLLATKATIESNIYQSVAERIFPGHHIQFQAIVGVGLVDAIENMASDDSIRSLLDPLLTQCYPDTEAIVLGCTHYPLISRQIQSWMDEHFTVSLPLIDPSWEATQQFRRYLKRHPEIRKRISSGGTMQYVVTGDPGIYDKKIRELFAREVQCQQILI